MTNRLFTIEEANNALPLVKRIAADIVRAYELLSEQAEEYKDVRTIEDRTTDVEDLLNGLKRSMSALSEEIEAYVAELTEIGCEMKDLQTGLVDFPSMLDDRKVFLCYESGEDRVEFWHELTEGYAGRKPLPVTVPEE